MPDSELIYWLTGNGEESTSIFIGDFAFVIWDENETSIFWSTRLIRKSNALLSS